MLKFPNKIRIKLVDSFNHKIIRIPNIIISIHLFAMKKNDYYLGPFFTDENGEIEIDKKTFEILSEAVLQTGLMDYRDVSECSSLVEINVLSRKDIKKLLEGRMLWGIIGREKEIYTSKDRLIKRIKESNNNFIQTQSFRINWDKDTTEEIAYEIPIYQGE